MIYRRQIIEHDPPRAYGDCHRTALACVLDLEPIRVPNFVDGGVDGKEFEARQRHWLSGRGLRPVTVAYPGRLSLRDILAALAIHAEDTYYLLGGRSSRDIDHTVVGYGGRVVWDPHPTGDGLAKPMSDGWWWTTYLAALLRPPDAPGPDVRDEDLEFIVRSMGGVIQKNDDPVKNAGIDRLVNAAILQCLPLGLGGAIYGLTDVGYSTMRAYMMRIT